MARRIAADAQEAIATARYVRMSPTKVRRVVDLIRGRHVDEARAVLQFTNRAATVPVRKVLDSAVANAEHNRGLPADELVVARAWVDEGPTLRRFRPRALGRATRIRKRTCHISVVVARVEQEKPARRRAAGTASKKAAEAAPSGAGGGRKTTARRSTGRRKTTGGRPAGGEEGA